MGDHFCVRYDIGVMGGAVIFVEREFGLNSCHVEVLLSILALCAIAGALNTGIKNNFIYSESIN